MECNGCIVGRAITFIRSAWRRVRKTILVLAGASIVVGIPFVIDCHVDHIDGNYDVLLALLSYWGGIIGGVFSFIGVRYTISSAKKSKKEDLAIEYMPSLSARRTSAVDSSGILDCEVATLFCDRHFNDCDGIFLKDKVTLENVGRGEISCFTVSSISCSLMHCSPILESLALKPAAHSMFDKTPRLIPVGSSISFQISLPRIDDNLLPSCHDELYIRLEYTMHIDVRGPFSIDSDMYKLSFYIDVRHQSDLTETKINTISLCREEASSK